MLRKAVFLPAILLLFLLTSCVMTLPPNPANPVYTVAVLPVYNATNDVDGPPFVRKKLEERLAGWHYKSMPIDEVDRILRDQMGITLGAHLEMTTPQKLGEALGVDGVIYGYLLNFDEVTTGVYNTKKVRVGFRLVDTKTGKTMWAAGQGVKSELKSGGLLGDALGAVQNIQDATEGLDSFKSIKGINEIRRLDNWYMLSSQQEQSVGNAALMSLGTSLVGKALGTPLNSETTAAINMIFNDFPAGPGGARGGVAVASIAPVEIPKPKMEMPAVNYFGFVDLYKKDFSADVVTTHTSKRDKTRHTITGKVAKRGADFRGEVDMSSMMKGEKDAPSWLSRMVVISREKEEKSFLIYPERKKYVESRDEYAGKEPKVEKERVGEEKIAGHPSVKYRVKITDVDGTVSSGLQWEAKDLGNFVVKTEFDDDESTTTTEFKNISLKSPSADLFTVPKEYGKAANMLELMMENE